MIQKRPTSREAPWVLKFIGQMKFIYPCFQCDKNFAKYTELRVHSFIQHVCLYCDKYYVNQARLHEHVYKTHSTFKCSKCPKSFLTNEDLFIHVTLLHKECLYVDCFAQCQSLIMGHELSHLLKEHLYLLCCNHIGNLSVPVTTTADFEIFFIISSHPSRPRFLFCEYDNLKFI